MPDYLTQCACFRCRKSFKRSNVGWDYGPTCPDCGSTTCVMGRNFRAPSVRAIKQWRKVEMLHRAGVRFAGTQSGELGHFPETLLEARAFIQRNRATLATWRRKSELNCMHQIQDAQRRIEKRKIQAATLRAQTKGFSGLGHV